MSELFEEPQKQWELPTNPEAYRPDLRGAGSPAGKNAGGGITLREISEDVNRRKAFREETAFRTGQELTWRDASLLYDLRKNGVIDNDDIYRYSASKKLGDYLGLDYRFVNTFYDEIWETVSGDLADRYKTPKSRAEAISASVQIAKNLNPMSMKGVQLMNLHGQLDGAMNEQQRKKLQDDADALWAEIQGLQKANEELGRGMPTDPLTFVITSTIQSAPATGKTVAAGIAGGLIGGGIGAAAGAAAGGAGAGPGFVGGAKIGYSLASFAASSADMAGLLYVDLLAAGVEQKNARALAAVGGGINGFIESGLGTVAGWGKSAVKAAGGKVLSKEAVKKISETASKNFIMKMANSGMAASIGRNLAVKTLVETAKQAGEEGLEEVLQYLVEQAATALGDALQDAPVDRNSFGSREFWAGMGDSLLGGIAGGVGFGIAGLPLTVTGNVHETARQTADLKKLAVITQDKAEFIAAAKEGSPLVKGLGDEQIGQMYDGQAAERNEYYREEAARAGRKLASLPTLEAPGEMRTKADGRYDVRVAMPEGDASTGTMTLIDEPTGQRMGGVDFSVDIETNTITIEGLNLSKAITNPEAVIEGMIKELAYANPNMEIAWEPDARMSEAAGADLTALKNKLTEANPRGAENGLQYYQEGDEFGLTREIHGDIEKIARLPGQSMESARDNWKVMNTARKFGMDVHEMIQGIMTEEELRAKAAENPQGVEAETAGMLDSGRLAAQQTGQRVGGGIIAIRRGVNGEPDRILYGNEAMKENFDRLRAITVITDNADPATLLHEWMHWMTSFVIPNSPRYRALLEEAVGKAFGKDIKMEGFTREHHEWLSKNFEHYLKTGEAPTAGLRALFRRMAAALKELFTQWTGNPELKRYFDELLAEPEGGNRQAETPSRARVQTDNEQQKAFAEMNEAERIAQGDLYTREEKAAMLYAVADNNFKNELKKVKNGTINPGLSIPVGAAPEAYVKKGLPNNNIFLPATVVTKATATRHTVGMDVIERLPELLNSPVMILKSLTDPKAFVTVIDAVDKEGRPVIVAQKPTLKKTTTILSIYGKDNFDNFIRNCIEQDKVIAADKNKAIKYVSPQELQSLKGTLLDDLTSTASHNSESLSSGSGKNFGILNQLIGERGAAALDKAEEATARIDNLAVARQMEEAGKDARAVRMATGWERGADGKWRYEIADVNIDTNSKIWEPEKRYGPGYLYKGEHYAVTNYKHGEPTDVINSKTNKDVEWDNVLYRVLDRLNFYFGDKERTRSEIQASLKFEKIRRESLETLDEIDIILPLNQDLKAEATRLADVFEPESARELFSAYPELKDYVLEFKITPYAVAGQLSLKEKRITLNSKMDDSQIKNVLLHEVQHVIQEIEGFAQGSGIDTTDVFGGLDFERYHRTAGEVEARNVQSRMGFTAERRLETLLADTEAVAREDQVFIENGLRTAQMSEFDLLFQLAYQGSPYWFDKHDNSYVGSGFGNLRHGWGHYLYGQKEAAQWFGRSVSKLKGVEGQIYHVDIPGDDELLHWEKPIAEQPEAVRQAADKLIAWDKNGVSNFNEAYNVREFNDGTYGFFRSISGKMKWPTVEEAQAAAKAEIKKTLTGKEFYNTLAESVGAKETSLLLDYLGVKGAKYFDKSVEKIGVPKSYNYVIYGDSDINIIKAGYDMLFQMTRDEIRAEALGFPSWRDWMYADQEAHTPGFDYAFRQDDGAAEPRTLAEIEAWYEKQWNEARVLAREAALGDDGARTPANAEAVDPALLDEEGGGPDWEPELMEGATNAQEGREAALPELNTERGADAAPEGAVGQQGANLEAAGELSSEKEAGPITTSEANRRLISRLPQAVDDFVLVMGQAMRANPAHYGAETEADAAARDRAAHDRERIYREVHPYIRSLALRMTTGKQLTDSQRRTVMSHIRRSLESGATAYRELYTSLTEDPEFRAYAEREVPDAGAMGEAQRAAHEAGGLTAFQRTRLAERIIDKDTARKIHTGEATAEEIEDYLRHRDEEDREKDSALKTLEGKLKESRGQTAEERAEADRWYRQYQKTRAELKAAVKEAGQLEKKLERARLARVNTAERMRAGRENAEAKLKEKLAAKREEISAMRKRLKEEVRHARAQGRIEVSWKWAEERAKLAKMKADQKKRAADRKAAARYLEANKKLTAWIMSADRIGMNVWVRQRELLLGIQNALFETGKDAARLRELAAEIKDIQKKIEKEQKRLARAKDADGKAAVQRRIEGYEAYLENLKTTRQYVEVMAPGLGGLRTGQIGEGADTVDTGTVTLNGKMMSVEEFRKLFFENKIRYGFMDSKLRKALRRDAKSLGEKRKATAGVLAKSLSQKDLLAIKEVMRQLNLEGRANWERRQFAIHLHQQDLSEALLFALDELVEEGKTGEAKRYIKAMKTGDMAERERLLAKGAKRMKGWFWTWDDKRLVQWMDGNQKGALYRFIIRERIRYANRRDVAINNRTGRILDIIGQGTEEERAAEQNLGEAARKRKTGERAVRRMKELGERNIVIEGIGPRTAARKWTYNADFSLQADSVLEAPTTVQASLADLMFLAVALDNKYARSHYLYGNLWSDDERALYEPKGRDGKLSAAAMEHIKAIGMEKERKIREAIDQHLFEDDGKGGRRAKGDLLQIVDAIRDDFETHFHETRAVYEDMFNMAVEGQDNYLPIVITEGRHAQAEKQSEVEALTQGSYQVRISPDKGMMLSRVDIGPTHQTEIETDIFKVFFKGVEREEHFAKFAPYVRDLNTVMRGRNNGSKQLAAHLTDIYGKWAVDRLYQHINMEGLPPSAKVGDALENAAELGRMLAGNAGVAYIAYNIPAWLAQYPNSIAAFFGKADARFILSACLEVMKPGNDLVERVFAKSPKTQQRVINVAEEYRQYLAEQPGKLKEKHAQFIEIGMKGQRHADRTMVCAGWWALYQTALKNGMGEEDAVVHADEITAETQPDLHALETSPMYKDTGLGKLFLRFSQPLNVVWQNLTYDSFVSREKSFGSTVARITAYGMAALLVAAMRGALAKQDGEDEPEKLTRQVFYYLLFSQFTESVPLIGNMVSGTVEQLVTGEGTVYSNRYFELAERVLDIPRALAKENYERAVTDALHALGLGAGLPVSQSKRLIKAAREGNPWIIFGFNPPSGAGRKKRK